jgi:hypothetical protein
MNAVERLLAHGEQLLALYDEMYRERIGDARDPTLPAVPQESIYEIGKAAISAVPRGSYWASHHWLQAAAEAAWLEAKAANVEPHSEKVIARTTELFRDRLALRQHLLDRNVWQQMVADVVQDCRAWDFLAKEVVRLSQEIADSAIFVEEEMTELRNEYSWNNMRGSLHRNLGLLRRYHKPPAQAATSDKQTNDKPVGRPQNNESLARDLLDGWRAYEPEEGRKTIDRYLAQRPDVRTLKTPEARQRKIASLRTTLESAQSLRASKARQKRQARGKNWAE